jgi:hypothetical protein
VCEIELEPSGPASSAYRVLLTDWSDELTGKGDLVEVKFVASVRVWPPGKNAYVTAGAIKPPHAGDWPVLLALDGDPSHNRRTRVIITTTV